MRAEVRNYAVYVYDAYQILESSEHAPVHSVMGVIALPHPGSVALHERLGFDHVGTVRDAGFKFDRWIDVGYWQLML